MNFLPVWNKKIADTIQWPNVYRKYVKYAPFLQFDRALYRKHALEELK
jgi:hypothetical protein